MLWLWLNLQVLLFEFLSRPLDLLLLARRPALFWAYVRLWEKELLHSPYRRPSSFRTRLALGKAGAAEHELVYGETPVWTAWRFFKRAGLGPNMRVVDLGAGRGRPLLAARLLGADAVGLELLEDHVRVAAPILASVGIELRTADLSTSPHVDGDLFLLNWSGLERTRRAALTRHLEQLPAGTRFVCVTCPLESPHVQTLSVGKGLFTWGLERVWVQELRAALADPRLDA